MLREEYAIVWMVRSISADRSVLVAEGVRLFAKLPGSYDRLTCFLSAVFILGYLILLSIVVLRMQGT
jgi:hypothetical protein